MHIYFSFYIRSIPTDIVSHQIIHRAQSRVPTSVLHNAYETIDINLNHAYKVNILPDGRNCRSYFKMQ